MPDMTPEQRKLARHALGLRQGRKTSYRNHFVTDEGGDHHALWMGLVESGLAKRMRGNPLTGGMPCFHLTRAGAEMALDPGEKLDPEDFPNAGA